MELKNHQWELLSSAGESRLVFGTADTGIQFITAPDLGTRGLRTNDREAPREDGTRFGVDYEEGTTLTFEANVLTDGWASNSDLLNRWRAAWSERRFRRDSNAYAVLRTMQAGRVRRCYGRPRRFAEPDADLTHDGYTAALADFATFDGKFYDEAVAATTLRVSPPASVGFTTPIYTVGDVAFATEDLDDDSLPGAVTVTGADTWGWIEVHGPISQPRIDLGSVTIALDHDIVAGETVVLDPRPWSRGVRRLSDGANLAGALTYDTPPMAEWLLEPGSVQATLTGIDPTGTATADVRWRNASHRP